MMLGEVVGRYVQVVAVSVAMYSCGGVVCRPLDLASLTQLNVIELHNDL